MSLTLRSCPNCHATFEAPAGAVTVRCPVCDTALIVPPEARAPAPNGKTHPEEAAELFDDVIFADDFHDPDSGWDTGEEEGVRVEYSPRGFRIYLEDDETFWEAYADLDVDDMSVEVEITRARGPRDAPYGLLCRVNDHGAYTFEIDGEGYYGIYKDVYGETEAEDESYTLAEGNAPGVVNTGSGAVNHQRAVCHGARLSLYVNGRRLLETEDDDYPAGDIGLLASTGESGRGNLDVLFNRFVVRRV
jgi:uncharacterized Zn finger protein (UPF0148 family)